MDTLNTVVGIVSLILGVIAMVLSFVLYRMAESGAEKMRESEQAVREKVEQLDRLFGLLYRDTFGLVRDSYNAMHGQIYGEVPTPPGGTAAKDGAGAARPVTRVDGADAAPAVEPGAPPVPGLSEMTARTSGLQADLVDIWSDISARQETVRVDELLAAAGRRGHSASQALEALFDLALVRGVLTIDGPGLTPEAVVSKRPEAT